MTLPASSVSATITGTISTTVPAQAQARLGSAHSDAAAYQPLLYITLTAQGAATILGTPGYTFYLPSSVSTANTVFNLSVFNPGSPTSNFLIGPATVTGTNTITFPLSPTQQVVFSAGQTYEFVLFGEPGVSPTSSPAPASTGLFTEFNVGGNINGIAAGPDGNIWITMETNGDSGINGIGKLSTAGVLQTYPVTLLSGDFTCFNIISGPQGKLWFDDENGGVYSITTSGAVTSYRVETDPLVALAQGPDGNVWAVDWEFEYIDQLNVSSGVVTQHSLYPGPSPSPGIFNPMNITTGSDGALWFTQAPYSENEIGQPMDLGRITTSGAVSYYVTNGASLSGDPAALTLNATDQNIWFTEPSAIGRMTPSGTLTEFPIAVGAGACCGIVASSDGSLWFIETNANAIGHMDVHGNFLGDYQLPAVGGLWQITLGPDGNIWFTQQATGQVGYLDVTVAEAMERRRKL